LILGERLTTIGVIGTALVLAGVAWFTRAESGSV
jgi:drug/metabolite transporter (DMT)-like permease